MDMNILTSKEIFPFEITNGDNSGKWIIYLPLVGYACIVEKQVISDLDKALQGQSYNNIAIVEEILAHLNDEKKKVYYTAENEDGLLNMMILPNNKCNFHCSYCYSAGGRSGKEISVEILKHAIAYFFDPSRATSERLTISVLGGGEPLLSWNVLRSALEYAFSFGNQRGRKIPVSLVTNGSIISDEIINYCKEREISISVSFDILEDIQNQQRGHYDLVRDNINRYANSGLEVALNTVITNANVHRMEEMISHMVKALPKVKKVSFKSLISDSYFSDVESRKRYYRQFVDNFFEAQDVAKQHGIYLTSPYQNAVICLADRYCPGKFVVTAEGTISICHCVSSSQDTLYDKFIFGTINSDGTVAINREKLKEILAYNQHKYERCKDCPAKWHCAGGCYTDNCNMNKEDHEAYCVSMRYFLEKFILKHMIN